MTVYRLVESNPKRKKRRCGPKCKAAIKRQLHHHAKEATRETISGALAGLMMVGVLVLAGRSGAVA